MNGFGAYRRIELSDGYRKVWCPFAAKYCDECSDLGLIIPSQEERPPGNEAVDCYHCGGEPIDYDPKEDGEHRIH